MMSFCSHSIQVFSPKLDEKIVTADSTAKLGEGGGGLVRRISPSSLMPEFQEPDHSLLQCWMISTLHDLAAWPE